ncbi:MAG: hypothetical protein WDZ83_15135 [Rhizobiaceae bacterium]
MDALIPVIVQIVAGVIGAYAVTASVPQIVLGQVAKIATGAVGGIVGGQVVGLLAGEPEAGGALAGAIRDGLGGIAGGAVLTGIVGPVMRAIGKS